MTSEEDGCKYCGSPMTEQGMFLLCKCGKTEHECECDPNWMVD